MSNSFRVSALNSIFSPDDEVENARKVGCANRGTAVPRCIAENTCGRITEKFKDFGCFPLKMDTGSLLLLLTRRLNMLTEFGCNKEMEMEMESDSRKMFEKKEDRNERMVIAGDEKSTTQNLGFNFKS